MQAGDRVQAFGVRNVYDFERVISQRGGEEPLAFGVNRKMIEAPFHAWKRNRMRQRERTFLCCIAHQRE